MLRRSAVRVAQTFAPPCELRHSLGLREKQIRRQKPQSFWRTKLCATRLARLSREERKEFLPDFVSIKNLDTYDGAFDYIQYQMSTHWRQRDIAMVRIVIDSWLPPRIERGTEIIAAAASVHNLQLRNSGCERRFSCLTEELVKLY